MDHTDLTVSNSLVKKMVPIEGSLQITKRGHALSLPIYPKFTPRAFYSLYTNPLKSALANLGKENKVTKKDTMFEEMYAFFFSCRGEYDGIGNTDTPFLSRNK